MTTLQIIEQREVLGKDFKIYGDYENPLFLAKDVAEWIEHSNARMMLQSVDDDEKVVKNAYTPGGNQEFSPQVRGCSSLGYRTKSVGRIFPAGAGVLLGNNTNRIAEAAFSPQVRGCSLVHTQK